MSDEPSPAPVAQASWAPEAGVGIALGVIVFGFAVLVLGLADARIFTPNAIGFFVPVAFGTGVLGLLVGGLVEFRANNTFGGTFCVLYACFLTSTGLMLKQFQPSLLDAAGAGGFGDAFGSWLLLWCVFTFALAYGAYHINMPAFIAFMLLAVAYALLGVASIVGPADPATMLTKTGGWVLVADGLTAWYLGWALAVNPLLPEAGRLPTWPYPYAKEESTTTAAIPPAAAAPTG
jgi:uncharacterized protein